MTDKMDQIKKLLSLANNNDNVHESALAMKSAQKLMLKYRISQAMLNDIGEEIVDDILYSAAGKRLSWWKKTLASVLAKVNGCKSYSMRRDGMVTLMIIGEPDDASTVRYMYSYIVTRIDEMTKVAALERGKPGKTWCNSFRVGAVDVIGERLWEAHYESRKESLEGMSGLELVRMNDVLAKVANKNEEAELWASRNLRLVSKTTARNIDKKAREAGRVAGGRVQLGVGKKLGVGLGGFLE